jgi:hypothetical protein
MFDVSLLNQFDPHVKSEFWLVITNIARKTNNFTAISEAIV